MSEFFYDIVIEATVTIMETIQERGVDLTEHRLMDNNMVLFTLCKILPNSTNLFIKCQVTPQPNLSTDLNKLIVKFFHVLT